MVKKIIILLLVIFITSKSYAASNNLFFTTAQLMTYCKSENLYEQGIWGLPPFLERNILVYFQALPFFWWNKDIFSFVVLIL